MKARFRRLIASLFERQARRLIARHHLKVVAVAGSVGKTSTKLAIAAVLSRKYRTLVHHGNYNSEVSLPLSIFELTVPALLADPFAWINRLIRAEQLIRGHYPYEVLVLELGTERPGEIPAFLTYLQPDIGVITAITPEHMLNFPGGLDDVAAEELSLAAGSRQVVANRDEIAAKYRHKYLDHHPSHLYYALGAETDYGFKLAETNPIDGTTGAFLQAGHARIVGAHFNLYGAHSAKAATAAYAVADLMGLTHEQIEKGLESLHPVAGRMNPLPGLNGSTIIDDTYNASPEAVIAALDALAATPTTGRRIGLLGSMNELGPDSPRYHAQVGAAAAGLDLLITLGTDANHYLAPAALAAGLDPTRHQSTDSPYAAGAYLKLLLQPGDIVLAKGSQNGVFAEEALKSLLADPADIAQLVRQSPSWLRIKARQFPDTPQ